MRHALEVMDEHKLATEEGQAADQQFDAITLEATGSELVVDLSGSITAAVRWTTYFKFRRQRMPRDPMSEHRAPFEAIAAGDAPAVRAATIALIEQAERDTETALTT